MAEALAWCLARAATLTAAGQSRKNAKATAYAEITDALQWQIMHADWWQALYTQFIMQRREVA